MAVVLELEVTVPREIMRYLLTGGSEDAALPDVYWCFAAGSSLLSDIDGESLTQGTTVGERLLLR